MVFCRLHWFCRATRDWLKWTIALEQMYFQQRKLTLVKLCMTMYRSLKRSAQGTRDGFDLYSAQASFAWLRVDLTRPLRRDDFRPFWIISFEFVKVCWIRFSIWKSFIGFYVWCYPISTILACLFTDGVLISWKKLCWKGCMAAEMPSRASHKLKAL